MPDLLIKGADIVLTMDDTRRELAGADVLVRGGVGKRADIAGLGHGRGRSGG